MKRLTATLLAAAMCMGTFAGCGSNTEETTDNSNAGAAASGTAAATESQTASAENVHLDALNVYFVPSRDPEEIVTATEPLSDLLKNELAGLGYDVDSVNISVGTTYEAVGEALSAGTADVGFIPGGTYVLYDDGCDVILTATRDGLNKDSDNPADWNDGQPTEASDKQAVSYRALFIAGPSEKGQELADKVNSGEELTWDDLDSAEEEDVKLFVDHISVICLLYNMFFKKECFAQEQEYRMVFLCVHKREHQVPENSIPVEYRIKDEVFIPFIRMKLGDISCLKSVCVGTKNTSDLAVKGLRHYFGSRNLEVRVKKSEIPLWY